jgi:hypothetical protein
LGGIATQKNSRDSSRRALANDNMDGEHGSIDGKVFTEFSEVRAALAPILRSRLVAAADGAHAVATRARQTKQDNPSPTPQRHNIIQIKTSAGSKRFLKFFLHEAGEGGGRYLAATGEDQGDAHYVYTVRL